jgi:PAS domain S-box-containing protein
MDHNAIVMADPSSVIRFWSVGAEKVFGYSAAQAVGQKLDLVIPEEYREAHWIGFRRAVESGAAAMEGQVIPFAVRQAGGGIAAAPGTLTLVRQSQGKVIAVMVVFD